MVMKQLASSIISFLTLVANVVWDVFKNRRKRQVKDKENE